MFSVTEDNRNMYPVKELRNRRLIQQGNFRNFCINPEEKERIGITTGNMSAKQQ